MKSPIHKVSEDAIDRNLRKTAMSNQPTVFVIVVTYNGAPWIRTCLDSILNSSHPCTPLIVDNASIDTTCEIIANEYKEIRIIELNKNIGFGAGNNIGISRALEDGADYCFLLNQDAYLLPDTLEILVSFLQRSPTYELATPLHCSPDANHVDPTTQIAYLQRYQRDFISDACIGDIKESYPIRGINAAAWLLSSKAIMKTGGFDPLFFMYGEDDDLINRFDTHKLAFALVPKARVVHLRGKNPSSPLTWTQSIRRSASRIRSSLMINTKAPEAGKAITRLLILVSNGALRPTIDFLVDRDLKTLLANYVATVQVIFYFPKALKNSRLCREPGPHFLDIQNRPLADFPQNTNLDMNLQNCDTVSR